MSPKLGEKVKYIPQTFELPGGFKVKVRQLKPMQMKAKHGGDYDGIWDIETMTIDLNKSLPHKRKWFVFSHEIAHIVNDWILWLINEGTSQGVS